MCTLYLIIRLLYLFERNALLIYHQIFNKTLHLGMSYIFFNACSVEMTSRKKKKTFLNHSLNTGGGQGHLQEKSLT